MFLFTPNRRSRRCTRKIASLRQKKKTEIKRKRIYFEIHGMMLIAGARKKNTKFTLDIHENDTHWVRENARWTSDADERSVNTKQRWGPTPVANWFVKRLRSRPSKIQITRPFDPQSNGSTKWRITGGRRHWLLALPAAHRRTNNAMFTWVSKIVHSRRFRKFRRRDLRSTVSWPRKNFKIFKQVCKKKKKKSCSKSY